MSKSMETSAAQTRPELIEVAETVARDKGIDRDEVLEAMEQAIQKAGRSKYGHEHDIRANIDRSTGEINLARYVEVVDTPEEVENEATQMDIEAAKKVKSDAEIGDYMVDALPPIDFGRIAAQTAKQVIVQRVREAERSRQFDEYKDRIGEVVNGLVKRIEYGNVIVDLNRAEAILRRDESIPREHFNTGDRVRSYIVDVREETRGPQIFLSRAHPQFMAKLFSQEVPEIYDGIIEINAQAAAHPDIGFIGCEPFVNGVANVLSLIDRGGLTNIRIFNDDVRKLFPVLTDAIFGRIVALFTDPWPKKRHHRRRFISDDTLVQLIRLLKDDGVLRLASDHMGYVNWMLDHLTAKDELIWDARSKQDWGVPPSDWVETRYERKAKAKGNHPAYLCFSRVSRSSA